VRFGKFAQKFNIHVCRLLYAIGTEFTQAATTRFCVS